ncbi:AAA-like domain-containing protein [Nostoc sp. ChiQUE01b]|uniref:AAA-like domain-containing protein n=1 Tax=Nostoc sp. ChiQUE01b TaxID=3075376 RepID=UPI002AD56BED|nr:AAA-like domain-containing protein [Nostoc sp. ChiQUE01b]MDZ8261280.1 AAA-like domain-containing protein [Nostoc sp. ChiQUE01b]
MAEPTIYTVGGTVQANEQGLYIPRQADAELLALCRAATFAYVLTPRQLGKSSLMIRTAEQLIEEGVQCVIIDISGELGVNLTAEQWYKGLLTVIADQLMLTTNLEQWWQTHYHLGVTQRLTKFFVEVLLTEINDCVVIFVDEIDTTLSLNFTDDFYATIRYFQVARATNPEFRRLSFVLIGVATPGDLIRDPKRTPFNIGQRVDLTDFTFEEAQPLAAGLGLPIETGQNVLRWVLKWTGGHPYLSQRLCRIIADRHQANWSEAEVDRVVGSEFLGTASEQDNNLQFVRDMLTKRAPHPLEQEVLNTYLQIYRSKSLVTDEEQSLVKSHLKLSGVVRRENALLLVRNRIYREAFNLRWIQKHLPKSLWQRLKPAMPLITSLFVFSIAMAAIATYAEVQRQEANSQRQKAEVQRQKAEQSAKNAEKQADFAEQQRRDANEQRRIALKHAKTARDYAVRAKEESQKTLLALQEIVQQRQIAVDAKKIAEQRRQQAETAQKAEAQQRLIAVAASKVAKQRRQQAETAQKAEAQQRLIAEQKTKEALTIDLSSKALAFRDVSPQHSLLLAVESLKTGVFPPTENFALLRRLLDEIGGTPLIGHEKPVVAVAFSPKGNWLATGSKDGKVRLWDKLNPDKPAIVLLGNVGEVKTVAISPDGKWLAAIGKNTKIQLWNLTAPNFATKSLILEGHGNTKNQRIPDPINALSFSPDSKWLATGGGDTSIRLWDLTTQVPAARYILQGHNTPIGHIVFSPSGRWLATGEADNLGADSINVRLWNMTAISSSATPIILKTSEYSENNIRGLTFSPDEKRLAAGISYSVQVWDLTSKNLATTPGTIIGINNGWIHSIAFSPDSRWLATGSGDLKLWDIRSLDSSQPKSPNCEPDTDYSVCRFILRGHSAAIVGVNFSPDGKRLATASQDGTARLWNITDLLISPIVLQGHEGWVNSLTFDAEGQWLATASEDTQARLWKVSNVLNDPIVLSGIKDGVGVRANAISPDGKWIASAGGDKIIRLWNATDLLRPLISLAGHTSDIYSLAFSPNRQWLASTGSDGTVRLWDMTNPTAQPHILEGPSFWSMAFSSSGRWLAAGSYDGTVRLWDMKKPSLPTEPSFVLKTQNYGVRSLAFSPNERRLVTGGNIAGCSDRNTLVWDLTKKNPNPNPISLSDHCDVVSDVALSPNSKWVATASWDGTARLWDLTASNPSAKPKIIKFNPVDRVSQVAFSPDGQWLAAGSWNYQVQLQDMNNLAKEPDLLTGHRGRVFGVEFSPDSQWLATSSEDHTIRLWNPTDSTAAPIVLRGHDSGVENLAFSSDSRWLLSGSSDARLWRVYFDNNDLLSIACRTAGRNLTPQEWQQAFGDQQYHKTCPNLPSKEIQSSGESTDDSFGGFIWQKFQEAIATLTP